MSMYRTGSVIGVGYLTILALAACGGSTPTPTVTSPSPSGASPVPTLSPTSTPPPTNTPLPTNTPQPTRTAVPTWEPVAMADIYAALSQDGYRRFPFTTNEGVAGFTWIKDNPYEQVTTWENGTVELEVLHDSSASARSDRMERKFTVLDTVLPAEFMAELRKENAAYNRTVESSVSGEPDQTFAYADEFQTVWAQYDASDTDLGGYGVRFSLWWWQSSCPPQYDSCYYSDFPGLESTGDSSFTFYRIVIFIPGG